MISRQEVSPLILPDNFVTGVAVSSQHEGNSDGKRNSDWDHLRRFSSDGLNPNWWTKGVAESDMDRLGELGLTGLRMSFEWARIMPEKRKVDIAALKRYRELYDHAKSVGLEPCITLNHFTLPLWVHRQGSWMNPENVEKFRQFTEVVASQFGETKTWITLNEPSLLANKGYFTGEWPPGRQGFSLVTARKNLISANEVAYEEIKKVNPNARVGVAHAVAWLEPANPRSFADKAVVGMSNRLNYLWMMDDMNESSDFIGLNFYHGYDLAHDPRSFGFKQSKTIHGLIESSPQAKTIIPNSHRSDSGWTIVPDYLLKALRFLKKRYEEPEFEITENGIDNKNDSMRAYYILHHMRVIAQAVSEGINVRGYYHWTATDSQEWEKNGHDFHFGLMGIDPETQERTVRPSARLLGEIAKTRQVNTEGTIFSRV